MNASVERVFQGRKYSSGAPTAHTAQTREKRRIFRSASELLAAHAGHNGIRWLPVLGSGEDGLHGLVGRGLATLISGRPKAGKTTLLLHVAKRWLDDGLSVAWLSEEPVQVWLERLDPNLGGILAANHDRLSLAFPAQMEPLELAEDILGLAPDVAIVDTLRAFCRIGDENSAAQVYKQMEPLIMACRTCDAAFVGTHHLRKDELGSDDGVGHAGSHAFLGIVDVAISFTRDPHGSPLRRQMRALSRLANTPDSILLELEEGGYRILGHPDAMSASRVQRSLEGLLTDEWQSTPQLRGLLPEPRPSHEAVRQALLTLQQKGRVERLQGSGPKPDQWRKGGLQ